MSILSVIILIILIVISLALFYDYLFQEGKKLALGSEYADSTCKKYTNSEYECPYFKNYCNEKEADKLWLCPINPSLKENPTIEKLFDFKNFFNPIYYQKKIVYNEYIIKYKIDNGINFKLMSGEIIKIIDKSNAIPNIIDISSDYSYAYISTELLKDYIPSIITKQTTKKLFIESMKNIENKMKDESTKFNINLKNLSEAERINKKGLYSNFVIFDNLSDSLNKTIPLMKFILTSLRDDPDKSIVLFDKTNGVLSFFEFVLYLAWLNMDVKNLKIVLVNEEF